MRFSPASLVAELRRRHVFRVAGIYAVVGWLVIQIAATVFPHLHLPGWTISFVIVLTVLGFPIALVLAWALEITPEGIQRTSAGTAAGDDSVVGTGASPQAIAADAKESAKTETKPLPSATAPPRTSLPAPPTPLIGREKEARELQEHLLRAEVRLLTLIGPGGTGKTRLAVHVASEQVERFADGTFFIDLAPITDPALVPSAIARVLGVTEEPERPLTETLSEYLREKQLLLVLDNLEQVTEAAPFIALLLAAAPMLKVLVTSRIPLHLRGEHEYAVPPLALPDPEHTPPERIAEYAAVRLFVGRASAVKADFVITRENAPAVAEICRRLDGLPLAIELAAARIKILAPKAMLSRLQSRLHLLTGGAKDLPERQQTLRAAIEWSYDLLSGDERVLFRRLSVFSGGRTLEAIEAICSEAGELEVLDGVTSLVDMSLVQQEQSAEGEPRFVMLETIHEYAREKLEESTKEAEMLRQRHAAFFLALAEEAWSHLFGAEQGRWFARLETEHQNFRAALRWALNGDEIETAGRLAGHLSSLWLAHGHFSEGRQWLQEVLASGEKLPPEVHAKALLGAANLALVQGEPATAEPLYEQSAMLYRQLEDWKMAALVLMNLGSVAAKRGDYRRAEEAYEECLGWLREVGEKRHVAMLLGNLGMLVLKARRDYARAAALYEESLALARESGHPATIANTLGNLGFLLHLQGEHGRAEGLLRESLALSQGVGDRPQIAHTLADLALVATAARESERAARLFAAAQAQHTAMGSSVDPMVREEHERGAAAARAQLDGTAWEQAWQEGAAMPLEEAVEYALQEEPSLRG